MPWLSLHDTNLNLQIIRKQNQSEGFQFPLFSQHETNLTFCIMTIFHRKVNNCSLDLVGPHLAWTDFLELNW